MNWKKLLGFKSEPKKVEPYKGMDRRKEDRNLTSQSLHIEIPKDELLASIQVKPNVVIEENKLVPNLDLSNIEWDKQVILIMDDEELVNFFLKQDLVYFETIANKETNGINHNRNENSLIALAKLNGLEDFLMNFKFDNYDLISVTSEYAAFAIRRNINVVKRVDFAILDISLGGTLNSLDGSVRESLNGIDVAYDISQIPDNSASFMIYTGNDLGKYSLETLQFEELLPHIGGLFKHLVNKDTSLIIRRLKLLGFLAGKDFNKLNLG